MSRREIPQTSQDLESQLTTIIPEYNEVKDQEKIIKKQVDNLGGKIKSALKSLNKTEFAAGGVVASITETPKSEFNELQAIEILRADMTRGLPFEDETFDLIFHPVSNCYVEEVKPIWRECWRVLKRPGILLAGVDNAINYLFDGGGYDDEREVVNSLPFNPLKNPEHRRQLERCDGGMQFSHSLEEQLGGQLEIQLYGGCIHLLGQFGNQGRKLFGIHGLCVLCNTIGALFRFL